MKIYVLKTAWDISFQRLKNSILDILSKRNKAVSVKQYLEIFSILGFQQSSSRSSQLLYEIKKTPIRYADIQQYFSKEMFFSGN